MTVALVSRTRSFSLAVLHHVISCTGIIRGITVSLLMYFYNVFVSIILRFIKRSIILRAFPLVVDVFVTVTMFIHAD